MGTRHYFHRADNKPARPSPVAPVLADPLPYIVLGTYTRINGTVVHRIMRRGTAGQTMGGQKGGTTAQLRGTANRFDSAKGQKAARRRWDKHHKMNHRIGTRLGLPSKRRPSVDHKALREQYSTLARIAVPAIWFDKVAGRWYEEFGDSIRRVLSERTALIKLGHLKGRGTFIPQSVKPIMSGMQRARYKRKKR